VTSITDTFRSIISNETIPDREESIWRTNSASESLSMVDGASHKVGYDSAFGKVRQNQPWGEYESFTDTVSYLQWWEDNVLPVSSLEFIWRYGKWHWRSFILTIKKGGLINQPLFIQMIRSFYLEELITLFIKTIITQHAETRTNYHCERIWRFLG